MSPLRDTALILAISTAGVFAVSMAYQDGYLRAFGLDFDILEQNLNIIIYRGGLYLFWPLVWVFLGLFSVVAVCKVISCVRPQAATSSGPVQLRLFGILGIVGCVFIVIYFVLETVYSDGREQANKDMNAFINGEPVKFFQAKRKIMVEVDGQLLRLVTCGTVMCAAIDPDTSTVGAKTASGHINTVQLVYFPANEQFKQTVETTVLNAQ